MWRRLERMKCGREDYLVLGLARLVGDCLLVLALVGKVVGRLERAGSRILPPLADLSSVILGATFGVPAGLAIDYVRGVFVET